MAKTIYPGSTTDRAAQVRAALKAKGWTSRDVSVRADYYSMGSTLRVVIKNPSVPLAVVEAIANEHESIDRDQWGEILSGGNRFVDVCYTTTAMDALASKYTEQIAAAGASVDAFAEGDNSLVQIGDTGYLMGRGANSYGYSLWKDNHIQTANTAEYLAGVLAIQLQQEGR